MEAFRPGFTFKIKSTIVCIRILHATDDFIYGFKVPPTSYVRAYVSVLHD